MTPYRHIVVGLDLHPGGAELTPGALAALAHARWLAEGESVRVTLLHSTAGDEFYDAEEGGYRRTGPAGPRDALDAALEELRGEGVDAALELTQERAWLAITRRVLTGPGDLVLVGKRNDAERGGPHVGSVAAKLLRKCPCAVWAVRPGAALPPRRLLAATDLTPVGERVLERAVQAARRGAAELHVVHAIQLTMAAQLEADEQGYIERAGSEASKRIRELLDGLGFEGRPELHVGLTSPTRAILQCVERYRPDLVVMATISRGGVPGLLIGNTAERLFQRLDTCLLTVKPADFVCPIEPGD